ncbi:MAG: hypothetical protein IEMM0008_0724 [bacterium]|nr:MAG: hypothetical protein IEMM0008_0724 [bacterium]
MLKTRTLSKKEIYHRICRYLLIKYQMSVALKIFINYFI